MPRWSTKDRCDNSDGSRLNIKFLMTFVINKLTTCSCNARYKYSISREKSKMLVRQLAEGFFYSVVKNTILHI